MLGSLKIQVSKHKKTAKLYSPAVFD